ncbi:Gfo/Idh/MocA family oxidoreductase [Marinomonas agarivorans]|nr:Gfo/Idh/MocA family oxidoreductase [Marinomonas agarivorans]
MPKTLRVATVGTGYFSQFHYNAWQRIENVELVALCNRSVDAAAETAEKYAISSIYTDFVAMLEQEKPDLVDIITPPQTHVDFVMAAVERGIPCICQKPFTPSLTDAEALCEKVQAHNGLVVIHENFRFQPWYQEIKQLLDSGFFGTLYQATFMMRPGDGQGEDAYLARQPYFREMERFLVHETAIHWVDVFRYLLGEVQGLYADLMQRNPVIKGEDSGTVLFNFDNQVRAVFDGNRLADHAAENTRLTMGEMLIEGSAGALTLSGNGQIMLRKTGETSWIPHDYHYTTDNFGGDCVYRLQQHVVDHLLQNTAIHNRADQYLTNLKIEELIYRSAELKQRMDAY